MRQPMNPKAYSNLRKAACGFWLQSSFCFFCRSRSPRSFGTALHGLLSTSRFTMLPPASPLPAQSLPWRRSDEPSFQKPKFAVRPLYPPKQTSGVARPSRKCFRQAGTSQAPVLTSALRASTARRQATRPQTFPFPTPASFGFASSYSTSSPTRLLCVSHLNTDDRNANHAQRTAPAITLAAPPPSPADGLCRPCPSCRR